MKNNKQNKHNTNTKKHKQTQRAEVALLHGSVVVVDLRVAIVLAMVCMLHAYSQRQIRGVQRQLFHPKKQVDTVEGRTITS